MSYQSDRVDERIAHGGVIPAGPAARAAASGEVGRERDSEGIDRVDELLAPIGLSIRERPMASLALLAGVSFAVGALWMRRNSQQRQSRF
jgi:hypothetical protein